MVILLKIRVILLTIQYEGRDLVLCEGRDLVLCAEFEHLKFKEVLKSMKSKKLLVFMQFLLKYGDIQ